MGGGLIRLSAVFAMLKHCAPGSRWEKRVHHYWVYYKRAEPYQALPVGDRSASDPEIQRRHIIGMVTFLGIDKDCVESMIPQIHFKSMNPASPQTPTPPDSAQSPS